METKGQANSLAQALESLLSASSTNMVLIEQNDTQPYVRERAMDEWFPNEDTTWLRKTFN